MTTACATTTDVSQVHQEWEGCFPGFINRTRVAAATKAAELSGAHFSVYDAQRVADPKTFAY